MTCSSCVAAVKEAVANHSKISNCSIDLERQQVRQCLVDQVPALACNPYFALQVVVDSELSAGEVKDVLESTGLKAALVGIGSTLNKGVLLQSHFCIYYS